MFEDVMQDIVANKTPCLLQELLQNIVAKTCGAKLGEGTLRVILAFTGVAFDFAGPWQQCIEEGLLGDRPKELARCKTIAERTAELLPHGWRRSSA